MRISWVVYKYHQQGDNMRCDGYNDNDNDDDGDNAYDQDWLDELAGEKDSVWEEY
jgi:hypothetical protein